MIPSPYDIIWMWSRDDSTFSLLHQCSVPSSLLMRPIWCLYFFTRHLSLGNSRTWGKNSLCLMVIKRMVWFHLAKSLRAVLGKNLCCLSMCYFFSYFLPAICSTKEIHLCKSCGPLTFFFPKSSHRKGSVVTHLHLSGNVNSGVKSPGSFAR